MGYAFTMYSTVRFEARDYGYADARRMLGVWRLSEQGKLAYTISNPIDIETGKPVTQEELQALIDAGLGDG